MYSLSCSEIGKLEEGPIQQQWSNGPKITTVKLSHHLPASSEISLAATTLPDVNIKQIKQDTVGSPRLYPIRPYHERLRDYLLAKDRIFGTNNGQSRKLPKRSTKRIRNFWKSIRHTKRLLVSAIVNRQTDGRFYADVSFLSFNEQGLLDTGANISCVGSTLATEDWTRFPQFRRITSHVKTADGRSHSVIGYLAVEIKYKNTSRPIKLFVIPSIDKRLILGVDFWKEFQLAPGLISCLDAEEVREGDDIVDNVACVLTSEQRCQLNAVISLFPSFEKQGLGITSLMEHHIDVGDAKPIKQRFYPVSPAVEKLMYGEIDRMIDLGVIEKSSSAWSSPMRLVVKPGKVRLCLDARKLNTCTKKDAYPLPSIEGIFARLI